MSHGKKLPISTRVVLACNCSFNFIFGMHIHWDKSLDTLIPASQLIKYVHIDLITDICILVIPEEYTLAQQSLGVYIGLIPSALHVSCVHSVVHTVLVGFISYLYILSSNFRRCVGCKVPCKILIFGIFFNFVTLTLSCFYLGSDVNQ